MLLFCCFEDGECYFCLVRRLYEVAISAALFIYYNIIHSNNNQSLADP